jgi:hypothetical protein
MSTEWLCLPTQHLNRVQAPVLENLFHYPDFASYGIFMFLKLSTSPKADNFESFEHAHRNVTALLK